MGAPWMLWIRVEVAAFLSGGCLPQSGIDEKPRTAESRLKRQSRTGPDKSHARGQPVQEALEVLRAA